MKKLILAVVFVFATGTAFMNANTTTQSEKITFDNCDDVYYQTRDAVTLITGSEYIGIAAAIAAENACLDEEVEIIAE